MRAGNIVPEPRAGSNSKARVHPNLKNPRLRLLQVSIFFAMILCEIALINQFSNSKKQQSDNFCPFNFSEDMSDRKMTNFPHCGILNWELYLLNH